MHSKNSVSNTLLHFCFLAVQTRSKQSDLEAVVKTLAPALLAELAKMKSYTSSSSKEVKRSRPSLSAGGKSSSSAASSSSPLSTAKKSVSTSSKAKPSLQKAEASGSTKTKVGVFLCIYLPGICVNCNIHGK